MSSELEEQVGEMLIELRETLAIAANVAKQLKQQRDELAAQVEVMRDALDDVEHYTECDSDAHKSGPICLKCAARNALSLTPSAALREIQARTLEELVEGFMYLDTLTAVEIREMAAAKRKGE